MTNGILRVALLVGVMGSAPLAAQAGWISEWRNIPATGSEQLSTMKIEDGRVRVAQPETITLMDYKKGQFTLLNPISQYFWSGTVDQYVEEMSKNRNQAMAKRMRLEDKRDFKPPEVDVESLPAITIKPTGEKQTIAGHETAKYEVRSNAEPFQEIWVAEDLDLSKDLDLNRFLAYQQKLAGAMLGKSAPAYNALYRSEDYRKLLDKHFALKVITYHIAGSFERTAIEIREEAVPASEFKIPDHYRRVRLSDVFPAATSAQDG